MGSWRSEYFAIAYAAGLGVAAFAGEVYAHRQSHRTMRMRKWPRVVAQTLFWSVGSDPITSGVEHRIHHAEEANNPARSPGGAVREVIGESFVSRRRIAREIAREDLQFGALSFSMETESDPLLVYDEKGNAMALKYEDIPSRWLAKLPEPISNIVIPSLFLCLAILLVRSQHVEVNALRLASSLYVGYLAGFSTAVLIPGIPENMQGSDGRGQGIDIGFKPLHFVIGSSSVRHRSHHEHPELVEPPGTPTYSVDHAIAWALEGLSLLELEAPPTTTALQR